MATVLDNYVTAAPDDQNALDIFKGQWTSRLPEKWSKLTAGDTPLFEHSLANWAIECLGGVEGKQVLELGPLEGGHSYMLQNAGASSVFAIEANTNAFLRCLVVKEILNLNRVHYVCGDFRQFFEKSTRTFDVIFASGVLYHMTDPARLLFDMSRRASQLFVWTHYFDAVNIDSKPAVKAHFGPAQALEWDGCRYEQYTYSYQHALDWNGFCGGSGPAAAWLTRDSILNLLQHCGFGKVTIGFDHPDHPHGPAFGLVAHRG